MGFKVGDRVRIDAPNMEGEWEVLGREDLPTLGVVLRVQLADEPLYIYRVREAYCSYPHLPSHYRKLEGVVAWQDSSYVLAGDHRPVSLDLVFGAFCGKRVRITTEVLD